MIHKNIFYAIAIICVILGFIMKLSTTPFADYFIFFTMIIVSFWQGIYISKLEKEIKNKVNQ